MCYKNYVNYTCYHSDLTLSASASDQFHQEEILAC